MNPIPLTISQLTRANYCPASVAQSVGTPNIASDASAFGNAVHAVLEEAVMREAPPDIAHHARVHAVDPDALAEHIDNVEQFDHGEAERRVELRVPGLGPFVDRDGNVSDGVSGTADLVIIGNDGKATVRDYKTGHPPHHESDRPTDQWAQGIAYGLALMDENPFLTEVDVGRYWTRDNTEESFIIDGTNLTALRAWIYNLVHRVVESFEKPQYRVMLNWDGCLGCDGLAKCPAFKAKTERAYALAGKFAMENIVETPEAALEAWELVEGASAIKRGADELKKNVLAPYLERHGPVAMSESTELRMVSHHSGSTYPAIRKVKA